MTSTMAEWRDRGYVPDSDNEDEDEDSLGLLPQDSVRHTHVDQHQSRENKYRPDEPHVDHGLTPENLHARPDVSVDRFSSHPKALKETSAKVNTPTPTTVEKLQVEIQRGLQTCKDVLETSKILSYLDEDDSPLSSLSSSPVSSLPQLSQLLSAHQEVTQNSSTKAQPISSRGQREAVPELEEELDGIPIDLDAAILLRPSRSLRPRTLLQLNPYSLEYAKYQQDCKRRGLAPVRLANFAAERAQANGDDTQGSAAFQSSDRASPPTGVSSPLSSFREEEEESQSPVRGDRRTNPALNSEDELPDVADILQGRVLALPTEKGRPRRRKDEAWKAQVKVKKPVFKRYDIPREEGGTKEGTSRQSSVFDLPPSPPRSGSASSNLPISYADDDLPVSQTTPRPLPTPVLSSDRLNLKRKIIDVSSSSQEQDLARGETAQHSSSDTEQDTQGFMQIRRKIKGVLPASWLKLDAHQQTKKTAALQKAKSPEKAAPLRGIATHVTSSRMQGTPAGASSRGLRLSSDAEDSGSSEVESHHRLAKPALDLGFSDSDIDMDGVVVEDEIDRMEPPLSRPFRSRTSTKKRQQRLGDSWRKGSLSKKRHGQAMQPQAAASSHMLSNRKATKRVKRSHRAAQLSVLDAPGFRSTGTRAQPAYLRVAARRRMSVRTPVPQNPARKFFRLATREDTVDLNRDLEAWRSGQLAETISIQEPTHAGGTQFEHAQVTLEPDLEGDIADVDYSATLDELRLSTATTIRRLRAQESRTRQESSLEAVAPTLERGPRRLAHIPVSRPIQRVSMISNVPRWLGQVNLTPIVPLQPTLREIAPPRTRAFSSAKYDQALPALLPSMAQGPTLKRKRKQPAPRLAIIDRTRPRDERLPISAPVKGRSFNNGDTSNHDTDHDRALAMWAVEHLAPLEDQQPTKASTVPLPLNTDVVDETMEDTFLKLFSWQCLLKTYLVTQSLWYGAEISGSPSGDDGRLEGTLVLLDKLLDDHAGTERRAILDDALTAFTKATYESPTAHLAATLLILRILCSVSRPIADSPASTYDGWSVLHPVINEFLSHHGISRGRDRTVYQDLGLAAVRFCYTAVHECNWQSADSIAKFWFKQYAENSMVELFVAPKLDQLELRSQQIVLSSHLQPQDTDFDVFLKIVAALLEARTTPIGLSGNVGRTTSRIQSLVFSLSPNNSRDLSDDQNLNVEDLVSMANIYALYEVLNEFATSRARPRFSLVEKLVDFPRCHWNVCHFALRTWSRFTHKAIDCTEMGDLHTLGLWMKKTIMQMSAKITTARNKEAELRLSGIQLAFRENASRTWRHILELLQAWKAAITRCPTASECKALLGGGDMEEIIMICKDEAVENEAIAVTICDIVQNYLDKSNHDSADNFRDVLHKQFRDVMSTVLSSDQDLPSDPLRAIVNLWVGFARVAVSHKQKNWDDFLSLPSTWSFGMLADSEISRQCKGLFMSEIMKHDTIHFELDRESFYSAWIGGLVQPEQKFRFENELTKTFILHETENLSLDHLRGIFEDGNGHLKLDLSDLKQKRIEVLKNVIRNIYSLQFDDEDSQDFLERPLNIHQGRNLLRLMTNTIKAQWQGLSGDQRAPYTDFAKAIITQLHIYRYKGFEIDPWFVDPGQSEFPKAVPFAEHFLLPVNVPRPVLEEHLIRIFMSARLQAVSSHQEHAFVNDIASALFASTTTALDAEGNLAVNTEQQFDFMHKVLSVYVENLWSSPKYALFGQPVISALVRVVRDWHFRLDTNSEGAIQRMLLTAVELLLAALLALRSPTLTQFVAKGAVGQLIDDVLELAIACTRRIAMLERLLEECEENIRLVDRGFSHAIAIYDHMTGQNEDRDCVAGGNRGEEFEIKTRVLEILDEGLHGTHDGRRSMPAWRMDEPLASTWDAWLGTGDDLAGATERRRRVLRKLEKVLLDADLLEHGIFETEEMNW